MDEGGLVCKWCRCASGAGKSSGPSTLCCSAPHLYKHLLYKVHATMHARLSSSTHTNHLATKQAALVPSLESWEEQDHQAHSAPQQQEMQEPQMQPAHSSSSSRQSACSTAPAQTLNPHPRVCPHPCSCAMGGSMETWTWMARGAQGATARCCQQHSTPCQLSCGSHHQVGVSGLLLFVLHRQLDSRCVGSCSGCSGWEPKRRYGGPSMLLRVHVWSCERSERGTALAAAANPCSCVPYVHATCLAVVVCSTASSLPLPPPLSPSTTTFSTAATTQLPHKQVSRSPSFRPAWNRCWMLHARAAQ